MPDLRDPIGRRDLLAAVRWSADFVRQRGLGDARAGPVSALGADRMGSRRWGIILNLRVAGSFRGCSELAAWAAAAALAACSGNGRLDLSGSGGAGGGGSTTTGGGGSGGPASCGADGRCEGDAVCVAGATCAPNKGTCTSDGDCQGDSYCCRGDCLASVRDKGICIPFGLGPRGSLNSQCKGSGHAGVFSPAVQCEWTGPKADEPNQDSASVLAMPLVADLPNDSGMAAEIVVISYNGDDGFVNPVNAPGKFGVIRILNGQTCELEETVADASYPLRASAAPALADLDGDGHIDIVARRNDKGLVAFKWDEGVGHFVTWWVADDAMDISAQQAWDGPSIFDIDGDGAPEVLLRGAVYDGKTGARLDRSSIDTLPPRPFNGLIPVVGELRGDGRPKLIATINDEVTTFGWNADTKSWTDEGAETHAHFGVMASHFGVADFGTPGATDADFDFHHLDGIAEIVAVNDVTGTVTVHTVDRQTVMRVETNDRGGPPVIGDFDHDGLPEIGVAGKSRFRVFDFDCAGGGAGCESPYVRWSQPSQDGSSAQTSAAIFDFDGDGRAEAVYADECFLRVYEGDTGTVLYSAYRTSATWYEAPLVADVDRDDSTEIVVNSNAGPIACPTGSPRGTPYVDPIHPGVRCADDSDCLAASRCVEKLCRCADDSQCASGTSCADPLAGTPGSGKVCRATHPNSEKQTGIRVLRDRLDRWASSRPLWNQHAYSITNIDDDGKIPSASSWLPNWKVKGLNNYRQNVQGVSGATDQPDVTASLASSDACVPMGRVSRLSGRVCNRGTKAAGAAMPSTFYRGVPRAGNALCVTRTVEPVPSGACTNVACDVSEPVSGMVTLVVNDDGNGERTTAECNPDNNRDTADVNGCDAR